jgi:hypothetical protein
MGWEGKMTGTINFNFWVHSPSYEANGNSLIRQPTIVLAARGRSV